MSDDYTATDGVLALIFKLQNGAAPGTGVYLLAQYAQNLLGPEIPQAVIDRAVSQLNNLFGNYPTSYDTVPSAIFTAIFTVIAILHLVLFIVNFSRGHFFYISIVWSFIALIKAIGFGLRTGWSTNILMINMALASEIFCILGGVFLITVNLILAQRLFTWRHPVGGSRRLFRYTMVLLYVMLVLVVFLTIFTSAIPYLKYLSHKSNTGYQICLMVSGILIILYSLTAISLLGLSYFFKPTRKDENLYTYQPWWIESFHPLYFVKKNAAREAEETFMKRNHNHRHAVRVIAATHHHYNVVEGLSNERGGLSHNKSIVIVTLTTLLGFVESILRGIAVFQTDPASKDNVVCRPIVAYICWGALETLIHILYLVGRVDLRFYKPDTLPARVRAIITAEQSFFHSRSHSRNQSTNVSDDESELDDEEFDDDYYEEDEEYLGSDLSHGVPPDYDDHKLEKFDSSNDNQSDFQF